MVNNKTVLDFFRCRIDTLSIHSIRDYSKTIALLSDFVPEAANTLVSPSVALLENWCMYLMNSGMTVKTVAHHVDVVSGLYRAAVAAGVVMPSDVFTTFRTRIREFESARHFKSISETDYNRLHSLICNRTKLPLQEAMLTDIFVISLLTGGMSPTDIALLRKETINLQSSTVISILAHYQENKRKYIFPLAQSELTRKQLERNITTGITSILSAHGVKLFGSLPDTISSYWAYAAMKCGYTAAEVYSVWGAYPKAFPATARKVPRQACTSDKATIITAVANSLLSNSLNWYAMKLRRKVTIDDIEKRLNSDGNGIQCPELFYPCQEITKRIRRKTIVKRTPVIPDIIFFKSHPAEVYPMFLKIGDLAWCYKDHSGAGSYAVIPRQVMERFQMAIGQFTSDYEVGPIGSITPRPGETIKILGGIFAGNEGELLKVESLNEKGVIYRLRILDDRGVEWKISVDPRQAKSISQP